MLSRHRCRGRAHHLLTLAYLAPTALIMVIEMMPMGRERLSLVAFMNVAESALRFIVSFF